MQTEKERKCTCRKRGVATADLEVCFHSSVLVRKTKQIVNANDTLQKLYILIFITISKYVYIV